MPFRVALYVDLPVPVPFQCRHQHDCHWWLHIERLPCLKHDQPVDGSRSAPSSQQMWTNALQTRITFDRRPAPIGEPPFLDLQHGIIHWCRHGLENIHFLVPMLLVHTVEPMNPMATKKNTPHVSFYGSLSKRLGNLPNRRKPLNHANCYHWPWLLHCHAIPTHW